ncbi:MAG: hypothetical protein GY938_32070 [Ketobacter sp.]|nr:hypothetical protein [Ketobacter sp.]
MPVYNGLRCALQSSHGIRKQWQVNDDDDAVSVPIKNDTTRKRKRGIMRTHLRKRDLTLIGINVLFALAGMLGGVTKNNACDVDNYWFFKLDAIAPVYGGMQQE